MFSSLQAFLEEGPYMSMTLKRMSRLKWKMLAIPRANPRMIHKTPSLDGLVSVCTHSPFE